MTNSLNNYDYSKQFVLIEQQDKKAYKKITSAENFLNLDDLQYKVITTVKQRKINDEIYSLIQYEDKEIGWVNLKDSVQIYRHPARFYKVREDLFQVSGICDKMNIKKDFIAHFKDKLLNIKSEIFYNGEKHLGVFIKNKFHGFHPAEYFDEMIEEDILVSPELFSDEIIFYKQSNLSSEITHDSDIENLTILAIFKELGILKVKLSNGEIYWTDSKYFDAEIFNEIQSDKKDDTQRFIDDLLYSVNLERSKTKEIAKTILSAKEFLSDSSEDVNDFKAQGALLYDEEIEKLKEENTQFENEIRKANNDRKLAENRLAHQLEYKEKLEAQKDKYKARMQVVEEKMKTLIEKNEQLKNKIEAKS